jgi:hypothetical protein
MLQLIKESSVYLLLIKLFVSTMMLAAVSHASFSLIYPASTPTIKSPLPGASCVNKDISRCFQPQMFESL